MFANVFVSSLRASSKMAPRVVPRAAPRAATFSTTVARRQAAAGKKPLDNEVRRGFDEIIPFLKRVPVDVYPLVAAVSFVCCLGVFFGTKMIFTDRHLRLKPEHAYLRED